MDLSDPKYAGLPDYKQKQQIAVQVDQTRDDTLLGASEAAAVLGLDRYRSPMSVWLAKRAARAGEAVIEAEKPPFVREAAEWGIALEPVVRGKYALATGRGIMVPAASVHQMTDAPWLRCTPDGFVMSSSGQDLGWGAAEVMEFSSTYGGKLGVPVGADGLLQVKTCSAWKADEWAEGVPPAYEVQVRVEMAVCDLHWCDVVCLAGGQRYLGPYRIHRDDAIESRVLTDLRAFWDLVVAGTPPSVDDSDAWKAHASSLMRPTKVAIPADDECRAFLVELRMARTERKRAETREAKLRNQLLLRLGAAGATVLEGGDLGKLTATPNPARTDYKGLYTQLKLWLTIPYQAPPELPLLDGVLREAPRHIEALEARLKKPGVGWQIRTPRDWSDDGDE